MPTKKLSKGEELFALHCMAIGLHPQREYRFCPDRRWRADFVFETEQIIVEIEGGTWSNGRHSRGAGMETDMKKYNRATIMGYRVLRYTTAMVQSGEAIDDVMEIMG